MAALAAVAVAFGWASGGAARLPAGASAAAFAAILGACIGFAFARRRTHRQRSEGRRHWRGSATGDAEDPPPGLATAAPACAGTIDDDWDVDALLGGDPADRPPPEPDIDWGDVPEAADRPSDRGPGPDEAAGTAVAAADATAGDAAPADDRAAPAVARDRARVPAPTDAEGRAATAPKRARKSRPASGRRSHPRTR